MPSAEGDSYGVDTPRCLSASARTGSFAQYTSACGLSFSATRRFITPVLLDSSVSKTDFTVIPVSRSKSFRIGSEKTWSSLTYTTTVRELVARHEVRIGIRARVTTMPIALCMILFRRREPSVDRRRIYLL